MLRHYFTITLRILWRKRFHTFINLAGLTIGISSCLVIYLIVSHELSFNKRITDYDRIYRIHSVFSGVFSGVNRGVPNGTGDYVREHFKGIEHVTLFFCFPSEVDIPDKNGSTAFDRQNGVILARPDYFNLFNSYEWLIGSPEVLNAPHQAVLTESKAKKYFNSETLEEVIGREIVYRDSLKVHVAGIVKDIPFRTDLVFSDFISIATIESSWLKRNFPPDDWASVNSGTQLFVKLLPGVSQQALSDQLPLLEKRYDETKTWDAKNTFNVQPLSDLHYNAELGIFDSVSGVAHLPTLITLSGVAFLLLVIASINFINLETAQAVQRAKEVGVRKVLGSSRSRLVLRFLSEGLALTFIAMILALPVAEIALTSFSEFVPKDVRLNVGDLLPFMLAVVVFIGLLASAYPAFVLSSYRPVLALKNQVVQGIGQSRTAVLRKVLIVFQFTFAQALILGTIMIGWQIRYMLNKDLGFKKDAVIYIETPWWEKWEKTLLLKNEIASIAEVSDLSLSQSPPSSNGWSTSVVSFRKKNGEDIKLNAYRKHGDTNYINFYGIQLLAGRNLYESDTIREVLINETMLKNLGFNSPEEALGEHLQFDSQQKQIPIVGVVKDFHTRSLHNPLNPVIMANALRDFNCINIRFHTAHRTGEALQAGLEKLEAAWKKIYPDNPFGYTFLDDTIQRYYQAEQRTAKLARTAMGMAIFISCLGLFGLASHTTTQRGKEIGIRKVLGASVRQIVLLLTRDFIVLVLIGFVIAAPIAWILIEQWLEKFTYRTGLSAWMFVATALIAILIAFVTVSYKTVTAARRNPSDSLRNE